MSQDEFESIVGRDDLLYSDRRIAEISTTFGGGTCSYSCKHELVNIRREYSISGSKKKKEMR